MAVAVAEAIAMDVAGGGSRCCGRGGHRGGGRGRGGGHCGGRGRVCGEAVAVAVAVAEPATVAVAVAEAIAMDVVGGGSRCCGRGVHRGGGRGR